MRSGKNHRNAFLWLIIYGPSTVIVAIPGAKLITTVRSIPTLYESTFGYYFAYVKEYSKAQTLAKFFSNPKEYFHPAKANQMSQYARNTMTHDLGYPEESRDLELRLGLNKTPIFTVSCMNRTRTDF